ncbi:MAG TPA: ABC transporter substrate-binding protein [Gaiellaceae bacterium]|nr:ABC transporter substrate-binding protein [Gaiellaceae bacterium]
MRKILLALAALAVMAVASAFTAAGSSAPASASAIPGCAKAALNLVGDGTLTVGTDNPAYPPWFGGGTPYKGSSWKINDPNTAKGFESAVAYAVAQQLGFTRSQVKWLYTPFSRSFAPGPKSFDFDINQISYTPARAKVVTFSASYYNVNQAIVVVKGTKIASVRSIRGLKPYKLGAQLGTTSYQYIVNRIRPSSRPAVFPKNDAAVQALKNKQIDGLVVDLPTAFYVTAVQVPNGKILGQFPTTAGGEHFGMVFQKGNSLAVCVNKALANLKRSGALGKIQQTWLAKATGAPVLR